jgi:hypothetical protein
VVVSDGYGIQHSTNGFMKTGLLAPSVAIWCNCGRPSILQDSQFQLKFLNLNPNFKRVHYAQKWRYGIGQWSLLLLLWSFNFTWKWQETEIASRFWILSFESWSINWFLQSNVEFGLWIVVLDFKIRVCHFSLISNSNFQAFDYIQILESIILIFYLQVLPQNN